MAIRELGRIIRQLFGAVKRILTALTQLAAAVNNIVSIFVIAFTPLILFLSLTGQVIDKLGQAARILFNPMSGAKHNITTSEPVVKPPDGRAAGIYTAGTESNSIQFQRIY